MKGIISWFSQKILWAKLDEADGQCKPAMSGVCVCVLQKYATKEFPLSFFSFFLCQGPFLSYAYAMHVWWWCWYGYRSLSSFLSPIFTQCPKNKSTHTEKTKQAEAWSSKHYSEQYCMKVVYVCLSPLKDVESLGQDGDVCYVDVQSARIFTWL